jgi:hypothetical protein
MVEFSRIASVSYHAPNLDHEQGNVNILMNSLILEGFFPFA